MLLKILRYLIGYLKIEITGFAPERFINLITKNNIITWNIQDIENGYVFYTGRKNLLKMKQFLKKTNLKLKIREKIGIPFLLKKYQKRSTFVLGFFIFFMIIYICSLFIWEVKVTGENKLVAETILKEIDQKYVSLGTLKSKINCSKLESNLRNEFDQISWISCELKGTTLTIHLEEGMSPKQKINKQAGDLIARKDAIITKIITRNGTPLVKKGQKVKKGDILISGTVYIYDDNNEVIETNYISADGDIYGTTTFLYDDYVDFKFYEKSYQAKAKKYITLFIGDYCFTPYIPKLKCKDYDSYTQIHKVRIFNNFYLPFGYKSIEQKPYQLIQKQYNEEEAKKILQEKLKNKFHEFEKKGIVIVKNNVKIEKKNNRMVAKGKIILTEPISIYNESSSN